MAPPPKRRFALLVAYDGAPFAGWQMQPGLSTVQETLGHALEAMGMPPVVNGASRTDKGVHARAMVVSTHARTKLPLPLLRKGIQMRLPEGIRLRRIVETDDHFHAQFGSVGKSYRYRIWLPSRPGGAAPRFSLALPSEHFPEVDPPRFDLAAMERGLAALPGTRPFTGCMHASAKDGLVQLQQARLERVATLPGGRLLTLKFRADRFGKYMVRVLTGIAIRAGSGELDPAAIPKLLDDGFPFARRYAGPEGLCLEKVHYPTGVDPFPWLTGGA